MDLSKKMNGLGIQKEVLVKALNKEGYRQSALDLQNWDKFDTHCSDLLTKCEEYVAKGLAKAMKKNPDAKADADLGEKVEHLVEEHAEKNKAAERKEGHKLLGKEDLDKVREEDTHNEHSGELKPTTKYKKYNGGDPRHTYGSDFARNPVTRAGAVRPAADYDANTETPKWKGMTSGKAKLGKDEHKSPCGDKMCKACY